MRAIFVLLITTSPLFAFAQNTELDKINCLYQTAQEKKNGPLYVQISDNYLASGTRCFSVSDTPFYSYARQRERDTSGWGWGVGFVKLSDGFVSLWVSRRHINYVESGYQLKEYKWYDLRNRPTCLHLDLNTKYKVTDIGANIEIQDPRTRVMSYVPIKSVKVVSPEPALSCN